MCKTYPQVKNYTVDKWIILKVVRENPCHIKQFKRY